MIISSILHLNDLKTQMFFLYHCPLMEHIDIYCTLRFLTSLDSDLSAASLLNWCVYSATSLLTCLLKVT